MQIKINITLSNLAFSILVFNMIAPSILPISPITKGGADSPNGKLQIAFNYTIKYLRNLQNNFKITQNFEAAKNPTLKEVVVQKAENHLLH